MYRILPLKADRVRGTLPDPVHHLPTRVCKRTLIEPPVPMPAACRSAALFWASLEKAPPGSTSAPIFTINISYEGTRNLFLPTEAANLCRIGVPDMHMKFHFYAGDVLWVRLGSAVPDVKALPLSLRLPWALV